MRPWLFLWWAVNYYGVLSIDSPIWWVAVKLTAPHHMGCCQFDSHQSYGGAVNLTAPIIWGAVNLTAPHKNNHAVRYTMFNLSANSNMCVPLRGMNIFFKLYSICSNTMRYVLQYYFFGIIYKNKNLTIINDSKSSLLY